MPQSNKNTLYIAIISVLSISGNAGTNEGSNILRLSQIYGSNGFKIRGITNAKIGSYVKGIGDINADGIDDILVGSASEINKSYVIFGKNGGITHPFELADLDGSNGFVINEHVIANRAGDFNADGLDDVLFNNIVIFGTNTPFPVTLDLQAIIPTQGVIIDGGRNYSSVGDVNGDGFDDLSVGSPFENSTLVSCDDYYSYIHVGFPRGSNYIVFGNDNNPGTISIDALGLTQGFEVMGRAPNPNPRVAGAKFGNKSRKIGDINGDGIDDFAVRASGVDVDVYYGGCRSRPKSYVIFGNTDASAFPASVDDLNGINGFVIDMPSSFSTEFPHAIGDFNQDGISDIAVCVNTSLAHNNCHFIFGQNQPFTSPLNVSSALDGFSGFATNWVTSSTQTDDENFFADINADGHLDYIKGSFSPKTDLHILFGTLNSFYPIYDRNALPTHQGLLIQASSNDITALDFAGDVNNDGIDDIIIGLPSSFSNKGQSFVIYGQNTLIFKTGFEPEGNNKEKHFEEKSNK